MVFTNISYIVFLLCVVILYNTVAKKMQNTLLFFASLFFYALNLPFGQNIPIYKTLLPIIALFANIVFTFYMAHAIQKASGKKRLGNLIKCIVSCVLVLCVFKYYNAFAPTMLGLFNLSFTSIALPLGISFYTFATISYVIDVYRKDMECENNFIRYAAFVTFFGTITSGPICRAQEVLPQMKQQKQLTPQLAKDALRLMLFGYFKWIAIANVLGLYVNTIFESSKTLQQYSGLTLMLTAFLYALQLYFEFAGYTDIARASARLLCIEIPVNFKTPYFATNFSSFWAGWHISLSSWLQDYIFMPLVWSRYTSKITIIGKKLGDKPPVISSVAIVFIISGFWHGNTLPFVVWGILQAVFRVGEELMHKWYKKPVKNPKLPLRIFKTSCVFILWSASLVFFRIGLMDNGTVQDAFSYLARIFSGISIQNFINQTSSAIFAGFYTRNFMAIAYIIFVIFVVGIGVWCDKIERFNNKGKYIHTVIATKPTAVRWFCYYVIIICIIAGFVMQSGGFGTVSFAYAQF